jgi:hypothetical protein
MLGYYVDWPHPYIWSKRKKRRDVKMWKLTLETLKNQECIDLVSNHTNSRRKSLIFRLFDWKPFKIEKLSILRKFAFIDLKIDHNYKCHVSSNTSFRDANATLFVKCSSRTLDNLSIEHIIIKNSAQEFELGKTSSFSQSHCTSIVFLE